jgi:hypothetical protein
MKIITCQAELDAFTADEWVEYKPKDTNEVLIIKGKCVHLLENSHAELRENSHAVLWENSHAVLWENSHAELRENSHAELWAYAAAHLLGGKAEAKAKTATIIRPKPLEWFETNGVKKTKSVILYKRVSKDFKTQEETSNETVWPIGKVVEHKDWRPKDDECGTGKFHACSRPYFCDEFRSEKQDDRYIAVQVALADTYVWPKPQYPHKIAFRKGKVLFECDRFGSPIKGDKK